jgi:hypothetical protein
MRAIAFAVSGLVLISAASAGAAAPKKKPMPALKRPATPAIAPSGGEPPAPSQEAAAPAVRGPTRIDFDDRLIQGQSNKSGAVYLYDRKELKMRSMIKKRDNFRDEIVSSVYDT